MKKFFQSIQSKLSTFLTPVPETEKEYIDRVVYLLRRDFNTYEQNKILLSVIANLSKLREEDLKKMEREYAILQENYNILKNKMSII
jgi:hypothetical protein